MKITYLSSAKDDLSKIDWRYRYAIIQQLEKLGNNSHLKLKPIVSSELKKLNIDNYIVICEENKNSFKVINVFEKQRIRLPE